MELSITQIQNKIYELHGIKVMLDFDLAALYEVPTKVFNQAVKRNLQRFPSDFMFQLDKKELENWRSQIVTSSWGGRRYVPFAFTEQGVAMLTSILNSERAIEVNIAIIRTFVLIRRYALNYKDLKDKLQKLGKKYNKNFKEIYQALNLLIEDKTQRKAQEAREPIGFKAKISA